MPELEDLTLYDQETGEPFVFSVSEQEFFRKQGFTNVPKFTPERRKQKRLEREAVKPTFPVRCRECGKVARLGVKPPEPRQVYCGECFARRWDAECARVPVLRAAPSDTERAAG